MYSTRNIFHLTHVNACACKIDDIEALMQSPCVHTRHMNDNLYVCMSVMYMHAKLGLYTLDI